ncbi:hypothetical protein J2S94_001811 [Arthrobacter bambusae]|nr:hypothetical protein [Arthrobacter bambusae]
MGSDSWGTKPKPMFEKTQHWTSALSRDAALAAITEAFESEGGKINREGDLVQVRTGSNWHYRLWGNLLSLGRDKVPVGIDIRARPAPDGNGSEVEAHAFDTFGRRLTDHVFFGAQETFEERLQALMDRATKATGSTRI